LPFCGNVCSPEQLQPAFSAANDRAKSALPTSTCAAIRELWNLSGSQQSPRDGRGLEKGIFGLIISIKIVDVVNEAIEPSIDTAHGQHGNPS